MKCTKCGMPLEENQTVCPNCGTKVEIETLDLTDDEDLNIEKPVENPNLNGASNQTPSITNINTTSSLENSSIANNEVTPNNNENITTSEINQSNSLNNTKNKSSLPLIVGIIIGIIVVFAVIFGVTKILGKNSSTESTTSNSSNATSAKITKQNIDFSGYRFTYSSNCVASISSDKLVIYGPNKQWIGGILYEPNTSYSSVVGIKDQLKTAFATQQEAKTNEYDFTNAVTEEQTYNNMKFLVTKNIQTTTSNLDLTYADAGQGVFAISVANSTKTALTDEQRAEIYNIVSTATKIS